MAFWLSRVSGESAGPWRCLALDSVPLAPHPRAGDPTAVHAVPVRLWYGMCSRTWSDDEEIMTGQATSDRVKGKTLRWTFAEGPQAGKTYEHTFHEDGTVEYRAVEDGPQGTPSGGQERERPTYAAYWVSADVQLLSYLAHSGFTLTVALNFGDHRLVSIASNSEQWFPASGTFEEVGTQRGRDARR
jgi:hypothetical protein